MAFTDNFSGTSGDSLDSRTGWARVDGSANNGQINGSNQLKNTSTTDTAYQNANTGSANHYVQAVWLGTGTVGSFICVRITDKDNFIGFRFTADTAREIYKRVAGSFTNLLSSAGVGNGSTFKLVATGDSIELFRNGSSFGPITETAHNTVTYTGVCLRNTTNDPLIDDWESTGPPAATIAYSDTMIGGRLTKQARLAA